MLWNRLREESTKESLETVAWRQSSMSLHSIIDLDASSDENEVEIVSVRPTPAPALLSRAVPSLPDSNAAQEKNAALYTVGLYDINLANRFRVCPIPGVRIPAG